MFFMPYNLIISLRNEVIELEISQKWSQIYFMKSIFFFFFLQFSNDQQGGSFDLRPHPE